MGGMETYRGLCMTCDQAPACGWRARDPERPVFHCEEFRCDEATGGCRQPSSASLATEARAAAPPLRGRDKGLCMNCDCRDGCTFRIPEGGVWRCEEYR